MPIYEYKCKKCGETFELLIRNKEKPQCPKCNSKNLKKLFSSFSTNSDMRPSTPPCPPCGERNQKCCGNCCCSQK